MKIEVPSLRVCLDRYRETLEKSMGDLSHAKADHLHELLINLSGWAFRRSSRLDLSRAAQWFIHYEYCRRGIAPQFRRALRPVPWKTHDLSAAAIKADAPYLDLQWLMTRYPNQQLPTKWRGLITLSASSHKVTYDAPTVEFALDVAERLMARRDHISGKCKTLKLTPVQQAGMRYLCTLAVRDKRRTIDLDALDVRRAIEAGRIAQLTSTLIDRRVLYWRAWKLAGGGAHWSDAAEIFGSMTGKSVTRQGMRDMINRMVEQKTIRTRRKRTKPAR